jgi:hypothetical protein
VTLRGPLQHASSPDCPQKSDDTEVHRSEGTKVQKLCIKYLLVLVNELCNETLVGNIAHGEWQDVGIPCHTPF